ncbi:MAG: hypothetical protein ACP5UN_02270 [Candidatus Micrarchaeia archaeon]
MLFLLTLQPMTLTTISLVLLISIIYIALVYSIQRKLYDPVKMIEHQAHIKRITNEMKEMVKNNQDISLKQKELMGHFKESMRAQLLVFAVLPLFFIFYYGILPLVFANASNQAINIIVPLTYQSFFILCIFILGLVLSLILRKYDSKKYKQKQMQVANNNP